MFSIDIRLNKAVLENGWRSKSVPDCYKNQQMCGKAADNYPQTLEFVFDCYKTRQMCDKAVNTYPSTVQLVPDQFKTQRMCDKADNSCPFVFDSVSDWYNSRRVWKSSFWRSFYDIRLKTFVIKLLILIC